MTLKLGPSKANLQDVLPVGKIFLVAFSRKGVVVCHCFQKDYCTCVWNEKYVSSIAQYPMNKIIFKSDQCI